MKHLIFIILITLYFVFTTFAQSPCPIITIVGPSSATPFGGNMSFLAKVEGVNLDKVSYKWTVSNGKIVNGQATPVLQVVSEDTDRQTVTATVEITGLPLDCSNKLSATGEIVKDCGLMEPLKLDEIGKSKWRDEEPRLHFAAEESKKYKDFGIVIRISAPQKDRTGFIKKRVVKFEKYLTEVRKIPKNKIKIVSGGYNDYAVEFFLIPLSAFDVYQD